MKRTNNKTWTDSENKLLLEYYYTMSEPILREILPGRSPQDMRRQVAYLTKRNKQFRQ